MDHLEFLRIQGTKGGHAAALSMSKRRRVARAKKAAAASAKVRSRKARERRRAEKALPAAQGGLRPRRKRGSSGSRPADPSRRGKGREGGAS